MGKHLWVSSDEAIAIDDRSWITTSIIFHCIFDRVEEYFKPQDGVCKEECYRDWGVDGIDLSYVDKKCFNIFCLRCQEALAQYPDQKMLTWLEKFPDQIEKRDGYISGIAHEWREILRRLELDGRYDAAWIEVYRCEFKAVNRDHE